MFETMQEILLRCTIKFMEPNSPANHSQFSSLPPQTPPDGFQNPSRNNLPTKVASGIVILIFVIISAYMVTRDLQTPSVISTAPVEKNVVAQEVATTSVALSQDQSVGTDTPAKILGPNTQVWQSEISPNNLYAFATNDATTSGKEIALTASENGPVTEDMDNLTFIDIRTRELKLFDPYNLANQSMFDPLKTIKFPEQFSLNVNLLGWSSDSRFFWGLVNLRSSGDPPVSFAVSLFKIDTDNWTVEKFPIPGPSNQLIDWLQPQNLNEEKQAVLLDIVSPTKTLTLYLYDLQTQKETVIVSYPSDVFSKYFPGQDGFVLYINPETELTGVDSRKLNEKWIDNDTISYTDLVTRNVVTQKMQ